MPKGDGTGPAGLGSMTGRGFGRRFRYIAPMVSYYNPAYNYESEVTGKKRN